MDYSEKLATQCTLVRDSSAVRRLFLRLAGAVGRHSALHKESSGFAAPTLGRHISTFRGHQILFSIRNPYINRFTNHFSIHSQPSLKPSESGVALDYSTIFPQTLLFHHITLFFFFFIYIYLRYLVSNTISISNNVHVV